MTERTESSSASASTLTRQTRSAASAYVGEITASTAQRSTARLISNSPFVALLHLTTPHEECPRRGQRRKCPGSRGTSVLPSGADIVSLPQHVRLVPTADLCVDGDLLTTRTEAALEP